MEESFSDGRLSRQTCGKTASLLFSGDIARRAVRVALVVGTILTLINQYDALLGRQEFSWLQAFLTYCVPYCVATYSAVMVRRTQSKSS